MGTESKEKMNTPPENPRANQYPSHHRASIWRTPHGYDRSLGFLHSSVYVSRCHRPGMAYHYRQPKTACRSEATRSGCPHPSSPRLCATQSEDMRRSGSHHECEQLRELRTTPSRGRLFLRRHLGIILTYSAERVHEPSTLSTSCLLEDGHSSTGGGNVYIANSWKKIPME